MNARSYGKVLGEGGPKVASADVVQLS